MILQALWTTLIGMGGVFAFLILLIGGMTILRHIIKNTAPANTDKIAVAIVAALEESK